MWSERGLTQAKTICIATCGARVLFVAPAIYVRDSALCPNRI
jgi:hypothetical protein